MSPNKRARSATSFANSSPASPTPNAHTFSTPNQRLPPSPPLQNPNSTSALMTSLRARYRDAVASLFGTHPRVLNAPCYLSAKLLDAVRPLTDHSSAHIDAREDLVAPALSTRSRKRRATDQPAFTSKRHRMSSPSPLPHVADQVVPTSTTSSQPPSHPYTSTVRTPHCDASLQCSCLKAMWTSNGIGPALMLRTAEELSERIMKLYARAVDADTNNVEYASLASSPDFHQYLLSACKLRYFNPLLLSHNERKAFFLNIYNSLMIHAIAVMKRPRTKFERISLYNIAAYNIGGRLYSLNMIEHGVLRANRPGCGPFAQPHFAHNDARTQCCLPVVDPRVHFALNCGAKSCPAVRFYSASTLDSTLDLATRSYLQDIEVDEHANVVTLPKLLQWYRRDFSESGTLDDLLDWAMPYLEQEKRLALSRMTNHKKQHGTSFKIVFAEYDWSINERAAPSNT